MTSGQRKVFAAAIAAAIVTSGSAYLAHAGGDGGPFPLKIMMRGKVVGEPVPVPVLREAHLMEVVSQPNGGPVTTREIVSAIGEAPGAWTDAMLIRHPAESDANQDHYYDVLLVAVPPRKPTPDPVRLIASRDTENHQDHVGVRVWNGDTCIKVPWSGPESPVLKNVDCGAIN